MKITCQACAAKYTIADEKVLGKVVKIRCKKCGATIVINGSDAPSTGAADGADAQGVDYAEGGSPPAWMVNVGEGDQRTMEDHEIVSAYQSGVVNDETFCWKDGMPDWLPLREIGQLYGACAARPGAGPSDPPGDEAATRIQAPPAFLLGSAAPPVAAPAAQAAHGNGNGSGARHAPAAPAPTARRAPGRAPVADLFGTAAQAGGEDDVMTSAPVGMPQPHDDRGADKLTGARNENSVLFSLNALTSKGGVVPPQPMPASAEASGLIDIRQLSAQIGLGENKKQSRIDDIMNLAGGGAFSPSLSAPVLSAPPIEDYAPQASVTPGGLAKNKKLLFGALGASAFVVVAAVGVAVLVMHHGSDETADKDKPAASASAGAAAASATPPADSAATNDTPRPSATEASPAASASAPAAAQEQAAQSAPKESAAKAAPANNQPSPPRESAPPKARETAPAGVPTAIAAAVGASSDAPFNMGEAKARLAAIAAGAQSCKRGDAGGTGRVVIIFAPSGSVQSATITGPPFEGTPTGACVSARFRGAHVPPFGGSPFSVAKSFTIN